MKIKDVKSVNNPLVRKIRSLDEGALRKKLGLFLLEGPKMVIEALERNFNLVDVVASRSFFEKGGAHEALKNLSGLAVLEDKIFNSLCTTASSCGILATAQRCKYRLEDLLPKTDSLIVYGDCIQDPGNLGTIIRTAVAFGASGLILSQGAVDPFSPKVVRASMGAVLNLPIVNEQDNQPTLNWLKDNKVTIVSLDASAKDSFTDALVSGRVAYVFGNEGHGLSWTVLSMTDKLVSIPISHKSESLNVAVAMGIVLCQAALQRPS